ncbi:MAG TPA: response regulator transcription factor [Verrucomicrobiales bacterium]|nr:response regulator transcription factor [Verrucomicrobiales bacterium]
MRLLLIEDELALRTGLIDLLQSEGYRVTVAVDGPRGLERALEEEFDAVILDVMLPGMSGFEVCAEMRRRGRRLPVLMLTARSQVEDRVTGLDCGADDYLVKPFSPAELLARLRALLRRVENAAPSVRTLTMGDVVVDFEKQNCTRAGRIVELSTKELRMLRLLAERAGQPVSREQFLDTVWEYNAWPTTRTVDNHMAILRAKLEADPAEPRFLKTVYRTGYRLDLPETAANQTTP